MRHPRIPIIGSDIQQGFVYQIQNRYFRAKLNGDYSTYMLKYNLPSDGIENEIWREIQRGSYLNPKITADDKEFFVGDIYSSTDDPAKYYKALVDGKLSENISFTNDLVWELVNERAGWMGLLRDEIGDTRLGDIMIPGTHDAGTEGIDENSYLVYKLALLQFVQGFEPQLLSNWTRTQRHTLGEQCRAGFRYFDLRIADMEEEDGSFRWWHGPTGHEIQLELHEMIEFLEEYPHEILHLDFNNFARPGNTTHPIIPIPIHRKDMIADILLEYLEPYLALQSELTSNPTMNEVLASGKNIILEMEDTYIRAKHDGFWSIETVYEWSGRTNPEDLFNERSERLESYRQNAGHKMTRISGCNTPNEKMYVGGLLRVYGDDESFRDIIKIIWPELLEIDPNLMSFEGMWTDLLTFSNQGTNTAGMLVRPSDKYTSGASVHYRGVNDMARYWLARPQKYKLNEIHVDDAVQSSTLVETAILSAKGEIPREVSVAFQGNAKDGYYIWDESGFQTLGGSDGLACSTPIQVRYRVISASFIIDEEWHDLNNKAVVSFEEGQYPNDAIFELQVSGPGFGEWLNIHEDNISIMIENNLDLYLRGSSTEEGPGSYAYTSYTYNLFGEACDRPPTDGYLKLVQW